MKIQTMAIHDLPVRPNELNKNDYLDSNDGFIEHSEINLYDIDPRKLLQHKISLLEGGIQALALTSSEYAIECILQCLCVPSDNIIAIDPYYGILNFEFNTLLNQHDIEKRRLGVREIERLPELIDAKTKFIICDSISRLSGAIADVSRFSTSPSWP